MNLAEELRLCSIDTDGYAFSPKVTPGLGGALVAELLLAGRARLDDDALAVADPIPTGDELVDELLGDLEQAGAQPLGSSGLLARVGMRASPRIQERLVAAGVLTVEPGGRSWIVVVRKPDRLRLTPAGEEPRQRLRAALLGEREPDPRSAVLATLASACGLVDLHVPRDARRAAAQRVAGFAADDALPDAVADSIEAAERATAGAVLGAQSAIHTS